MENEIREIFEKITERYELPIKIGSRCESNTFYRVEDLRQAQLELLCEALSEKLYEALRPEPIDLIVYINFPSEDFPKQLAESLGVEKVLHGSQLKTGNGVGAYVKDSKAILLNEVITTARSCLEIHSKLTFMGAQVLSWGTLIDRTFGPGPVPVVATHTGDPVRLLE